MRALRTFLLILCLASPVLAVDAPYTVESKVQEDLETLLSHLIPTEQFLVQVNADINVEYKRKLVEGEMDTAPPTEETEDPVRPMPGFDPDMESKPRARPRTQGRQVYQWVESPVLSSVRIRVTFDQTLTPNVITTGKRVVQDYVVQNYPRIGHVYFNSMTMLQPKKEAPAPAPVKPQKHDDEDQDNQLPFWVQNIRWFIMGGIGLMILMAMWLFSYTARGNYVPRDKMANQGRVYPFQAPSLPPPPAYSALPPGWGAEGYSLPGNAAPALMPARPNTAAIEAQRMRLLEKFISHAEAFRLYYERITPDRRAELQAALGGPALDSLLENLGIPVMPSENVSSISNMDGKTEWHEKQFDEFVLAKEWQDRQFFGFMQQLAPDQLFSLLREEDPHTVCLVMRFLKPAQCAILLDQLPQDLRQAVMSQVGGVQQSSLAEILQLEGRLRGQIRKMPSHLMRSGAGEDMKFWGEVLSESNQSDQLFQEMERTNPGLYPQLKKYRFTLDEVEKVPAEILTRALSETDNDELGLALTTCEKPQIKVLLTALPERRRQFLIQQASTYRGADRALAKAARTNLARRIREMMES